MSDRLLRRSQTAGGALRSISCLSPAPLRSHTVVCSLVYSSKNTTFPRTASTDANKPFCVIEKTSAEWYNLFHKIQDINKK